MRILLDANVPRKFKAALTRHSVSTAREHRVQDLKDRDLLDAVEGQFDVLVTLDRNLQFQQRIANRSFAVAILLAPSNRLPDLLPLAAELNRLLPFLKPGTVREIG